MSYPMDMDDMAHTILRLQRQLFGEPDPVLQTLVLGEECGEVMRVVAKTKQGIRPEDRGNLGEELADVLIVALGLCAMNGINPDRVVAAKLDKLCRNVARYRKGVSDVA